MIRLRVNTASAAKPSSLSRWLSQPSAQTRRENRHAGSEHRNSAGLDRAELDYVFSVTYEELRRLAASV
jgi:hypothetical protein